MQLNAQWVSSSVLNHASWIDQGAVTLPKTSEDVFIIVNLAREHNAPFIVACGLHPAGVVSSSEGGFVNVFRKMRKIVIDTESTTITAQGGCIWENVDVESAKYGLATVGGE